MTKTEDKEGDLRTLQHAGKTEKKKEEKASKESFNEQVTSVKRWVLPHQADMNQNQ